MLMKQYYEAHVTMTGDRNLLEEVIKSVRWKFSAIDGDPNLGEGVKLYATRQYNKKIGEEMAVQLLKDMAEYLVFCGATILRRKIELVIFDDRVGLVKCTGACPECI